MGGRKSWWKNLRNGFLLEYVVYWWKKSLVELYFTIGKSSFWHNTLQVEKVPGGIIIYKWKMFLVEYLICKWKSSREIIYKIPVVAVCPVCSNCKCPPFTTDRRTHGRTDGLLSGVSQSVLVSLSGHCLPPTTAQ